MGGSIMLKVIGFKLINNEIANNDSLKLSYTKNN